MSNMEMFEEKLRSDKELQKKVEAAYNGFEGDKSDERALFDAVIAPLAAELGLPFTFDEGLAYAKSTKELSAQELEAVAGGADSSCYINGQTDDTNKCPMGVPNLWM